MAHAFGERPLGFLVGAGHIDADPRDDRVRVDVAHRVRLARRAAQRLAFRRHRQRDVAVHVAQACEPIAALVLVGKELALARRNRRQRIRRARGDVDLDEAAAALAVSAADRLDADARLPRRREQPLADAHVDAARIGMEGDARHGGVERDRPTRSRCRRGTLRSAPCNIRRVRTRRAPHAARIRAVRRSDRRSPSPSRVPSRRRGTCG